MPKGKKAILAKDATGFTSRGFPDWLTRHADEPGIFMPARHGAERKVIQKTKTRKIA
jgi:hypothetical protein